MKRYLLLGRIAMTNLEKCIKKQRHHFADKGLCDQSSGFSSSHVCMWELDCEEGWEPKNWCFWTVGEESWGPLDSKEIKSVNPKEIKCEYSLKVKVLSRVRLFAIPWTVAYQALLSMEFSRQEYWSRLPFPSQEDLPDPGIKPRSPTLQADALPSEPPRNFFSDWRTTIIGYRTSK